MDGFDKKNKRKKSQKFIVNLFIIAVYMCTIAKCIAIKKYFIIDRKMFIVLDRGCDNI